MSFRDNNKLSLQQVGVLILKPVETTNLRKQVEEMALDEESGRDESE